MNEACDPLDFTVNVIKEYTYIDVILLYKMCSIFQNADKMILAFGATVQIYNSKGDFFKDASCCGISHSCTYSTCTKDNCVDLFFTNKA